MKKKRIILGALAAVLVVGPAMAHHSAAMFDAKKSVTLVGTIKEFQFTNPHSWVQIIVPDANGKQVEWSIEWGGVSGLYKQGIRKTSLKPGDQVTIIGHPLQNGNPSASMSSITDAKGMPIGQSQR
jgi:Family of unknown function (DUF6152)